MGTNAPESRLSPGLLERMGAEGFAFLSADRSRGALPSAASMSEGSMSKGPLPGWESFAASWDDLGLDRHMADQGRYRRRRHGVLRAMAGRKGEPSAGVERLPDAPHYQELENNRLNGGVDRSFLPVTDQTVESVPFQAFLGFGVRLFSGLMPGAKSWLVEAHQFRIEARSGMRGQPTPEGVHRDGVDFVLVALVRRENIESGTTTIHGESGAQLGAFTLTEPLDMALVDDRRVWHGVTAVEAVDPEAPAWRDVLVLTFRRESEGG